MAMMERVKFKRVRGNLLQDQLTLTEAIKYARGLESADQYATKVENQTPTGVTVKLDALRALTRASCRSTKSYFTSSSTVLNTINTNKESGYFPQRYLPIDEFTL